MNKEDTIHEMHMQLHEGLCDIEEKDRARNRRDEFAKFAMMGLAAGTKVSMTQNFPCLITAIQAVGLADATIKELDKEEK